MSEAWWCAIIDQACRRTDGGSRRPRDEEEMDKRWKGENNQGKGGRQKGYETREAVLMKKKTEKKKKWMMNDDGTAVEGGYKSDKSVVIAGGKPTRAPSNTPRGRRSSVETPAANKTGNCPTINSGPPRKALSRNNSSIGQRWAKRAVIHQCVQKLSEAHRLD